MQNVPQRPADFPEIEPFTFERDGVTEKVPLTTWVWSVQYVDDEGGELEQYDKKTNIFHQFKEIDMYRPFYFRMRHAVEDKPGFTLLFNPETMKLIHYYKNGILKDLTEFPRIHIFGYEHRGVKHFMAILPDGELVITDNAELLHF